MVSKSGIITGATQITTTW